MRLFKIFLFSLLTFFSSAYVLADPSQLSSLNGMVWIPEGTFELGDRKSAGELNLFDVLHPDRHALGPEDPAHDIYLDGFYIDIFETTNKDYGEFMQATEAKTPAFWKKQDLNSPEQPVVGVNWKEAFKYCQWRKKRLPTEAEWEKASRGKRPVKYPWGNETPDKTKLNFNGNVGKTTPGGHYESGQSDFGVYDLSGNVSEWVKDWHNAEYYLFSPDKNPQGPEKGLYKIIRGGNWRNKAEDVRLTYRNATVPKIRSKTIGFRCAADKG